jgi:ubiquinone/menaquinone biosynthesis C-methylase UbiE
VSVLQDNYPQMSTTALELSPYYLQAARQNVKYWAQLTGNTRNLSATRFVQAAAEAIPEPDNSYDVVRRRPHVP